MIDEELEKILEDNISGSETLLSEITSYLLNNYESINDIPLLLTQLKSRTSDFQIIQDYLHKALLFIKEHGELHRDFFENIKNKTSDSYSKIAEQLSKIISHKSRIITLSNSKTLSKVFHSLKESGYELEIIVCESRPNFEGRIMAEYLDLIGIKTTLIIEADIPQHIQNCNYAIIRADKILADKSIVNKKGSNLLAILSKNFNIPFLVLTRREKFTTETKYYEKEKNPSEIWDTKNNSITMNNYYFEKVEKELISYIITD